MGKTKCYLLPTHSNMKSPNFENCQIAMNQDGMITKASESFGSWVGKNPKDLIGKKFLGFLFSLEASWKMLLPKNLHTKDFETFLPLSKNDQDSSIGVFLSCCNYDQISVVSLSPALAPHDSLKKAFMGDLMKDPRALANTLIRLQKAESRLSDYVSNFPGIFFTQRSDMTFTYLSRGIRRLFPTEHEEFS